MCYLLERGMRTLHARMPIHTSNAAELAKRLSNHSMIESVNHISLPEYDDYELAKGFYLREVACYHMLLKEEIQPLLNS